MGTKKARYFFIYSALTGNSAVTHTDEVRKSPRHASAEFYLNPFQCSNRQILREKEEVKTLHCYMLVVEAQGVRGFLS